MPYEWHNTGVVPTFRLATTPRMRHVHRMALRMLPGPFLGSLALLMFLLVMQFLIKYLPNLVGKGLPLQAIVELIAFNLAYMVVLAVPMSVLIASIMAFGRLAETGAWAVIKSAGVSFGQLVWPFLLVGVLLTGAMGYFNNVVLPEANFRARTLWIDIRTTRPGFELKPGVFYDWLDDYMILVRNLPPDRPDRLEDVLIFDYTDGPRFRTDIKAASGTIRPVDGGRFLEIELMNGEIHRKQSLSGEGATDRYERMTFDRHRMRIETPDLGFSRSDPSSGRRTDRTMNSTGLRRLIDSLDASRHDHMARMHEHTVALGTPSEWSPERAITLPTVGVNESQPVPDLSEALAGLDSSAHRQVYDIALQNARAGRSVVESARHVIHRSKQRAGQLLVEIHKKNSLAVACLIFMLIGAPIGLSMRRGGLHIAALVAIGIFLFYWVTLVNGEKLADRELLTPWVGMWAANLVGGAVGIWLTIRIAFDRRATPTRWSRLRNRLFPPLDIDEPEQ